METMTRPEDLKSWPRSTPIDETQETLSALLSEFRLTPSEYQRAKEITGRTPTLAELAIFSSMWSEHCSYKSSRIHLKNLPTTGDQVVLGPGENAGVVRLKDKLCLAFKMESHNHPSFIEPYQGAATGVGGILRDVFCMGARPVANLNCLRFGMPDAPRMKYLYKHVVQGVGDYGNCVGIPTVGGSVSYHERYNGNILVNAMTVGMIHEDRIFKGEATGIGNLVLYVGSSTGRDGIHGASMASDSFGSEDPAERSAVQVGDPFTEKLLLEVTLELLEKGLVVGLQDMGAAGLTSSSFEMADRANSGLYLNLDKVPKRAEGMSAFEILLSESQERMLMVIEPDQWGKVIEILDKWQLAYGIIGVVTDTQRMEIAYDGEVQVDLPVKPLAEEAPRYERPYEKGNSNTSQATLSAEVHEALSKRGVKETLLRMLCVHGDPRDIYERYDRHIGTRSIQVSDQGGAAVLWMRSEWVDGDDVGMAVTAGCNERLCDVDAKIGAEEAVTKCARSIFAAGGLPLAATDCLNYGNPEDPTIMGQLVDGIEGIGAACRALNTPIVSGNVSLYNETEGKSIPPTPMIGMVGRVDALEHAKPATCKQDADLYLVSAQPDTVFWAGSLAAKTLGVPAGKGGLPEHNWQQELNAGRFVRDLCKDAKTLAVRDVGSGGIALCVAKMVLPGERGFAVDPSQQKPADYWLGERWASYVVARKPGEAIQSPTGCKVEFLGRVSESLSEFQCAGATVSLNELRSAFENQDILGLSDRNF